MLKMSANKKVLVNVISVNMFSYLLIVGLLVVVYALIFNPLKCCTLTRSCLWKKEN